MEEGEWRGILATSLPQTDDLASSLLLFFQHETKKSFRATYFGNMRTHSGAKVSVVSAGRVSQLFEGLAWLGTQNEPMEHWLKIRRR